MDRIARRSIRLFHEPSLVSPAYFSYHSIRKIFEPLNTFNVYSLVKWIISNWLYGFKVLCILLILVFQSVRVPGQPIDLAPHVLDTSSGADLGLMTLNQSQTTVAFKAKAGTNQYNHGAVLYPFGDSLYVQWQSSKRDEDGPDTRVLYASSADGEKWTKPRLLCKSDENQIVTNGGWWSFEDSIIAFLNIWPVDLEPRGGYTIYRTSKNGYTWSKPRPILDSKDEPVKGVIEQDLKVLPSGRILTAIHMQPGLHVSPFYTDQQSGRTGWTKGHISNLPAKPEMSRELEPSWFLQNDGTIIMVFRDQAGSFKILASQSKDNGKTWTTPAVTNIPDSRAKLSAGNLPDGTAYIINNPSGSKDRVPLSILLSADGKHFDRAYALRTEKDLPPMMYEGKYKRRGYSYPKSLLWKDDLWVAYAVNKEDIAITKVRLINGGIKP